MSAPPRVVGVRQTCSAATLLRRSGASRSRRVLSTRLGVARVATASTIKAPEVALDSAALAAAGAPHFEGANTVFVEEFRIRGNEAGPEQRANIVTIANLLQEVGGNHGVAMWGRASSGFAAMPGMDHLIFVATRMQIRMRAYPMWGDLVRLETYFAEDGRLTTRRDWVITDAVTGEHLGAATSTWVTINAETRKLAKIPADVKQKFLRLAPSPPRSAIPTRETRRKLPEFAWPAQLTAPTQLCRRSDMDPNGHVNNTAYLAWALDVIPDDIYRDYQLTEVEMDFKAECIAGEHVDSYGMHLAAQAELPAQLPLETQPPSEEQQQPQPEQPLQQETQQPWQQHPQQQQQFLHLLRKGSSDTETEVWRARTTWSRQKQQGSTPSSSMPAEAAHSGNGSSVTSSSSKSSSDSGSAGADAGAAPLVGNGHGSILAATVGTGIGKKPQPWAN